jgi:hypothetical protein
MVIFRGGDNPLDSQVVLRVVYPKRFKVKNPWLHILSASSLVSPQAAEKKFFNSWQGLGSGNIWRVDQSRTIRSVPHNSLPADDEQSIVRAVIDMGHIAPFLPLFDGQTTPEFIKEPSVLVPVRGRGIVRTHSKVPVGYGVVDSSYRPLGSYSANFVTADGTIEEHPVQGLQLQHTVAVMLHAWLLQQGVKDPLPLRPDANVPAMRCHPMFMPKGSS